MSSRIVYKLAPVVAVAVVLIACGGGGGGNSFTSTTTTTTPPPPPALSVTTTRLPDGVVGKSYAGQVQATGGTAPYTWSASTTLPTWLVLDAKTGTVTGTPPSYSSNYITFTATDSATPPASVQKQVSLSINNPLTLTGTAPAAIMGLPYTWQSYINGGRYPFTATIDSGLPAGVSFNLQNGTYAALTGTPTVAGDFTANLDLKDTASPPQEVIIPIKISVANTVAIATTTLRNGVIGRAFTDSLKAVNGTAPLHWAATNMPAGLTLDASTGVITGTPTQGLNMGYAHITVTDSSTPPQSYTRDVQISIYQALTFAMPATLNLHVNSGIMQNLYSYGGVPPVVSSVVSGSLPTGLQIIDVNKSLQGTPTQTGVFTPTIHVQDSDTPPGVIEQSFTITVLPPLPVLADLPLPNGALGKAYSARLWARDGTLPYHWSVVDGQLPPGLTLDDTGAISGTPTAPPSYYQSGFAFTAAVTDSATPPQTASRGYAISIASTGHGRNDSIATATPLGYPGTDASFSPFADPADSTTSQPDSDYYRLLATAGAQVSLSVGASNVVDPVIEILDGNGQRYKTCRDVADDNPTLTMIVKDTTPAAFDDDCLNDDVDPTVNRSASLQFLVPGAPGTHTTFYAHVFDASGNARPDMTYRIDAYGVDAPLSTSNAKISGATVGMAYTGYLPIGGGVKPYAVSLAGGSQLPPGLVLSTDANGQPIISGTPMTKGNYAFTVQVGDSSTASAVVNVNIALGVYDPLLITADSLPDYHIGQSYSYVLPTSGGVPPLLWGFSAAPWCCVTLNTTTGEWVGIPDSAVGSFSARVSLTDGSGRSTGKVITLKAVP